ncbi:MAG: dihydroorotate dehydrogenase electron transfer subunit [Treponema sp.]|jgi:NAD(P)H-flavin reductase|nr:dihydroorotate dehydrogenase electron transfer subunit [Treponema sp.]
MGIPWGSSKKNLFCKVSRYQDLTAEVFQLELSWPGPSPRAGQFFMLKPQRTSVFLGRPVSVTSWKPSDQGSGGLVAFSIAKRGRGTQELARIQRGELVELTGPLGNYWGAFDVQGLPGHLALVGGGIGIAPCVALAAELPTGTFDFYGGFKSLPFGLENIPPHACIIATEDGSHGRKGRILDFLEPARYRCVYACGPEPMLKALADRCKALGVPCFISLERHMACGVGACLGCTVSTIHGNRRCCVDGPIFRAQEVRFDPYP